MSKCKIPGCDKEVLAKDYCKQHYKKFISRPKQKAKKAAIAQVVKETEEVVVKNKEIDIKTDSDKTKVQLTASQLEKIFLSPCRTEQELKNYIKFFFGLHLPDFKVSRYADTTPFHAIWEVYNITVNKQNPKNIQEILYVAGRGSGKTLGMAIAELMVLIHDQRDVVHVGAILSQAKRCYEYQQKFLLNDRIKPIVMPPKTPEGDRILEKTTMERSVFNVGDEKITLEVLPCTLKALNGPHVPLVVVDEIDTVSGESVKAYKEISGMLDSKRGKRPLRVGISTRKTRYGLMNQAIENAEKQGRNVRRWTAFEFTERCPDTRSGTSKIELYIDQNSFDVRLKQDYEKLAVQKQKDYERHEMYEGCLKCPLAPICLGDAKRQTSKSPMLKSIDELAQKVLSEGPDWAMAQLMNLKPSVEGIIYKEFDERVHVKSWNDMWLILTGKEFPGECNHDIFVKKCHAMGLQSYAGIDWGWSNPHTLVVFFVDSRENIYVVRCDGQTYISRPAWMHIVKHKWHNNYRTQLYFPDMADPGDAQEMRKMGLPTTTNSEKANINTGIQVIKKWLRTPGSNEAKIFFASETCKPLIQEFQLYHFKADAAGNMTDDPDTEHDHWLDALRYCMVNLFGKNTIVLGSAGVDFETSKIVDSRGHFIKPPTPEEYAKVNNIPFSSDYSTDNIGKIGKLSELDEEEEKSAEGGFIWTM